MSEVKGLEKEKKGVREDELTQHTRKAPPTAH